MNGDAMAVRQVVWHVAVPAFLQMFSPSSASSSTGYMPPQLSPHAPLGHVTFVNYLKKKKQFIHSFIQIMIWIPIIMGTKHYYGNIIIGY